MIVVLAVGVGEAHEVQPVLCHVLAVLRPGKQAIDEALIGVVAVVTKEVANLDTRRRQTCEVKGHPSDQRPLVGLRIGPQIRSLELA